MSIQSVKWDKLNEMIDSYEKSVAIGPDIVLDGVTYHIAGSDRNLTRMHVYLLNLRRINRANGYLVDRVGQVHILALDKYEQLFDMILEVGRVWYEDKLIPKLGQVMNSITEDECRSITF